MTHNRTFTGRLRGRIDMLRWRLPRRWATEIILRRRFRAHTGRELDVLSPVTMTEKVFARMILMDRHDDTSVRTLVDKLDVRDVIGSVAGREYLVPLLWSGSNAHAVPFEQLPHPSILKPTHMTGGVIRIDADLDHQWARRHARGWLREDIYWPGREFQYHRLPARLMVEAFLSDGIPDGPLDYSVWCFHGRPHMVQLRNHSRDINLFVDLHFEEIEIYVPGTNRFVPRRPQTWRRILEVAAALSAPFEFVRVDCYAIGTEVYVGELTFTPAGGKLRFASERIDAKVGELWRFDPETPVLDVDRHPSFRSPAFLRQDDRH